MPAIITVELKTRIKPELSDWLDDEATRRNTSKRAVVEKLIEDAMSQKEG